jgi:hypothetical protein
MPQTSSKNSGASTSNASQKRCFCPHTCGVGGALVPRRTYYNHKKTTQEMEAAGTLPPVPPTPLAGPSSSTHHSESQRQRTTQRTTDMAESSGWEEQESEADVGMPVGSLWSSWFGL